MTMEAETRALYVISVAAELAGVHPQTLRIYERKGLLSPARTSGRSRRYSDRDIALLKRIQDLTTEGVSLAGVQKILSLEDELAAARERIARLEARVDSLLTEMEERVQAAHRQYKRELVPLRGSSLVRFQSQSQSQRPSPR
jgi:MerR family transcriptional regulator/heat shock protein HspR